MKKFIRVLLCGVFVWMPVGVLPADVSVGTVLPDKLLSYLGHAEVVDDSCIDALCAFDTASINIDCLRTVLSAMNDKEMCVLARRLIDVCRRRQCAFHAQCREPYNLKDHHVEDPYTVVAAWLPADDVLSGGGGAVPAMPAGSVGRLDPPVDGGDLPLTTNNIRQLVPSGPRYLCPFELCSLFDCVQCREQGAKKIGQLCEQVVLCNPSLLDDLEVRRDALGILRDRILTLRKLCPPSAANKEGIGTYVYRGDEEAWVLACEGGWDVPRTYGESLVPDLVDDTELVAPEPEVRFIYSTEEEGCRHKLSKWLGLTDEQWTEINEGVGLFSKDQIAQGRKMTDAQRVHYQALKQQAEARDDAKLVEECRQRIFALGQTLKALEKSEACISYNDHKKGLDEQGRGRTVIGVPFGIQVAGAGRSSVVSVEFDRRDYDRALGCRAENPRRAAFLLMRVLHQEGAPRVEAIKVLEQICDENRGAMWAQRYTALTKVYEWSMSEEKSKPKSSQGTVSGGVSLLTAGGVLLKISASAVRDEVVNKVIALFELPASRGDGPSCHYLSYIYRYYKKDGARAADQWREKYEASDYYILRRTAESVFGLDYGEADALDDEEGILEDMTHRTKEAFAKEGYVGYMYELGRVHLLGIGVTQDIDRGLEYLLSLFAQGEESVLDAIVPVLQEESGRVAGLSPLRRVVNTHEDRRFVEAQVTHLVYLVHGAHDGAEGAALFLVDLLEGGIDGVGEMLAAHSDKLFDALTAQGVGARGVIIKCLVCLMENGHLEHDLLESLVGKVITFIDTESPLKNWAIRFLKRLLTKFAHLEYTMYRHPLALYWAGVAFCDGSCGTQDRVCAKKCFYWGAQGGHAESQYRYAQMCDTRGEAFIWYGRAMELGHRQAKNLCDAERLGVWIPSIAPVSTETPRPYNPNRLTSTERSMARARVALTSRIMADLEPA